MCASIKSLIYICIIVSFVPSVFSIKCWTCRSSNDPKCADPFDNSTVPITDCNQEKGLSHLPGVRPTMCRKIRQKVNGEWRYFRDCAYLGDVGIQGDERFCLMRTGTYNIFLEYCSCNSKDGFDGQMEVSRSCAWIDPNGKGDQCVSSSYGPVGDVSSCELCDNHDVCNGADTLGKTLLLLSAPLTLLLFK